jgi:hypothetical protein
LLAPFALYLFYMSVLLPVKEEKTRNPLDAMFGKPVVVGRSEIPTSDAPVTSPEGYEKYKFAGTPDVNSQVPGGFADGAVQTIVQGSPELNQAPGVEGSQILNVPSVEVKYPHPEQNDGRLLLSVEERLKEAGLPEDAAKVQPPANVQPMITMDQLNGVLRNEEQMANAAAQLPSAEMITQSEKSEYDPRRFRRLWLLPLFEKLGIRKFLPIGWQPANVAGDYSKDGLNEHNERAEARGLKPQPPLKPQHA